MFQTIMQELHEVRKRLDTHIDKEQEWQSDVRKDISKICTELATHKTKLGVIVSVIAVAWSSIVAMVVDSFHR